MDITSSIHKTKIFLNKYRKVLNQLYYCTIVLLFLKLFLSAIPIKPVESTNIIDGSWSYTLASFFHQTPQIFTKDVFFTYGPLSPLVVTTIHHTNTVWDIFWSNVIILFIALFLVISIVYIIKSYNIRNKIFYLIIFIFANIMLIPIDTVFMLYLFILGTYLIDQKNEPKKIVLFFGVMVFCFYKNSFLLATIISIPLVFFRRDNLKRSILYTIISFAILIIVYYILTKFKVTEFWNYFYFAYIDAASFSEYLSIPFGSKNSNDIFVLLFSILLISFLATFRKDNWYRQLFKLMVIFFAYKHGIVRSDGHLVGFVIFIPIILFEVINSLKFIQKSTYLYTLLVTASFVSTIVIYQQLSYVLSLPEVKTTTTQTNLKVILKRQLLFLKRFYIPSVNIAILESQSRYNSIRDDSSSLQRDFNIYIQKNNLSDIKLLNLSNATFYAESLGYPTMYSIMMQNYESHPYATFDEINLDRLKIYNKSYIFASDVARDIDDRHNISEMNETFNYLFTNYMVVASSEDKNLLIFEKNQNKEELCTIDKEFKTGIGEKIELPEQKNKLKISVHTSQSVLEIIRGIIFKPEEYRLLVQDHGGNTLNYRTFESTLQKGFVVRPFYRSFRDAAENLDYGATSFSIESSTKKKILVKIYSCN